MNSCSLRAITELGIYPAVDLADLQASQKPIRSSARSLAPDCWLAGLVRYKEPYTSSRFSVWTSSEDDKKIVGRARRIQRFMSQPFAVAEQFTGIPGKYVKLEETISSSNAGTAARSIDCSGTGVLHGRRNRRRGREREEVPELRAKSCCTSRSSHRKRCCTRATSSQSVVATAFDGEVGILTNCCADDAARWMSSL